MGHCMWVGCTVLRFSLWMQVEWVDVTLMLEAEQATSEIIKIKDKITDVLEYGDLWEKQCKGGILVSGMEDPNSVGARRIMRSSGRLTRTIALVKQLYRLESYEGWGKNR